MPLFHFKLKGINYNKSIKLMFAIPIFVCSYFLILLLSVFCLGHN